MYNTDTTMKELWLHLVRDFRGTAGLMFYQQEEQLLLTDMTAYRKYETKLNYNSDVYSFKMSYQMSSLFKRYRFANDAFTDVELSEITSKKFLDTQLRLATPMNLLQVDKLVIREARRIVKDLLGPYDLQEHYNNCEFGKRATVGSPLNKSYLDIKASPPYTASAGQREWYDDYLKGDHLMRHYIETEINVSSNMSAQKMPTYTSCDLLTLFNVAKSWKSFRCIMPNTDLGAFISSGLARMLEDRLLGANIDLRYQQDRHKRWARKASKNGRSVTTDLQSASDSYRAELVRMLVPLDWYRALDCGRIRKVDVDGSSVSLVSFMTMGIGFTFPLQTLLFYALLKGIAKLTSIQGRISVFGDDLIYPTELHYYVVNIFPRLGFLINKEKTFYAVPFRESCGGDYYRGVDVRPFQPEGCSTIYNPVEYAAFIHKLINGLKLRWCEEEIPGTLLYLYKECIRSIGCLLQVPPSFPDYSGIKVEEPRKTWFLNWAPVVWRRGDNDVTFKTIEGRKEKRHDPKWVHDNGWFTFGYISVVAGDRTVMRQLPYMWMSIRPCKREPTIWSTPRELIRWKRLKPQPKNYRSSLSGRRLVKKIAVVEKKNSVRMLRQVGTTTSWF